MGVYEIFKWIYSFENENLICLKDSNTNIVRDVLVKKNDNGFAFSLLFPHYKMLYDENTLFSICNKSFEVRITHFLPKNESFNSRLCEAYMFQSIDFDNDIESYHCYYSKITCSFLISFLEGNQTEFSINIDGFNFTISTCKIDPDTVSNFLCLKCDSIISFKEFKHLVNNIITSIGFLVGKFHKLEELYFQSNSKDFSAHTEFLYRNSNKKYNFPHPFSKYPNEFNCKLSNDLDDEMIENFSSIIDENNFQELVLLIIKKPRIYFSIKMLFDFYEYSSISRVSSMFVILETLCDELNNKTDRVEKELKKVKGENTLTNIKDKISNEDYLILEDIVAHIHIGLSNNAVHFEQTFKSLKIHLNDEDRKLFKQRNNFLHGRIIPESQEIKNEEDFYQLEIKYEYYSWRLYVLICKLILKKISFEGYLINYPKIFEDSDILKESYFIKLK
ncbi:hypothetical protein HNP99_002346 [Flavobacterium sp. 28A]|uniref:hypothetical protein n=1 Tax=Flavobacterium sp. 28A TaxID=2735895 RepID=UPI00156ECEA7|nr:hypothetical protein [Flavobacterium sp. 28A]NRT15984.1 hypothetical protein [Flavobacterium sp. 28A]